MLERIICYLKKLFRLPKPAPEEKIDEFNLEKETNLELVIQDQKDGFEKRSKVSVSTLDIFDNVQKFDVVYAKMRDIDITPNFPSGHQNRPFLVVQKDDENREVQGYYMTNNMKNTKFCQENMEKYRLVLSSGKYSLPKNCNGLVKIDKKIVLPADHIKKKISTLQMEDQDKLHKLSSLYSKNSVVVQKLEICDIMIQALRNYYLIYQQDYTFSYGFKLNRTPMKSEESKLVEEKMDLVLTDRYLYQVNFSETERFSNQNKMFIVSDMINITQLVTVLDNRKQLEYLKKHPKRKNH